MFTDYTCFSLDLLDLCIEQGLAEALLDCTASGPVDESVAYLRERLAERWNPSDELLRQVCHETGAWDDLDTVDRVTLIDRAIFCSLPDPLDGSEFARLIVDRIYSSFQSGFDAKQFIRELCQTCDSL